jgi:hypothetical protein
MVLYEMLTISGESRVFDEEEENVEEVIHPIIPFFYQNYCVARFPLQDR